MVKFPTFTQADRQLTLLLGATTLALYLRTLAPGLLPGDPGEFQFAAWQLGLAHPTGYPLYLLLGWLWQHLLALVGIAPSTALNALSAVFGTLGVMLCYLLLVRWVPGPGGLRRIAALNSALVLATNLTFWSQALIAEVYTLHMVLVLGLLLAVQHLVARPARAGLLWAAALAGLALTHHAMTLLLLPPLLLYYLLARRNEDPPQRTLGMGDWLLALGVSLLPLLLYLYIPLRSGPEASPWYHQRLGDGVLHLYHNDWASFWAFISGQSIAVGFRTLGGALDQLPAAGWLWRHHFGWTGLALMAAGIVWLARTRQTALLALTLTYALLQQTFNLFYNIGDILVYYIPLYLVGAIWAGCGVAGLASGHWRRGAPETPAQSWAGVHPLGWVLAGAVLLLLLRAVPVTAAQIDQSTAGSARQQWETILAAEPPADAILISNDRNEIVPLFYLQTVEDRAQGMTGLFPLIAPDPRFADIGTTIATALDAGGDQPVYLIKPMSGLEVRYQLDAANAPLIQVLGPAAAVPPAVPLEMAYGPLTLTGYTQSTDDGEKIFDLYWRVDGPIPDNYTATLQLVDGSDTKLAQEDHAPGGVYYPTSLWTPGTTLVVRHRLPVDSLPGGTLPADAALLTGFYRSDDPSLLAPLLRLAPVE